VSELRDLRIRARLEAPRAREVVWLTSEGRYAKCDHAPPCPTGEFHGFLAAYEEGLNDGRALGHAREGTDWTKRDAAEEAKKL
jgi:hypothetical protein